MIKVTGTVRMSNGLIRITSYSGWQNISIQWTDASTSWEYWY